MPDLASLNSPPFYPNQKLIQDVWGKAQALFFFKPLCRILMAQPGVITPGLDTNLMINHAVHQIVLGTLLTISLMWFILIFEVLLPCKQGSSPTHPFSCCTNI
jgi:hypothetical protein